MIKLGHGCTVSRERIAFSSYDTSINRGRRTLSLSLSPSLEIEIEIPREKVVYAFTHFGKTSKRYK